MEQFFGILQRGLGQLDATGEYEEGTLRELKESYQKDVYKRQGIYCEWQELQPFQLWYFNPGISQCR